MYKMNYGLAGDDYRVATLYKLNMACRNHYAKFEIERTI